MHLQPISQAAVVHKPNYRSLFLPVIKRSEFPTLPEKAFVICFPLCVYGSYEIHFERQKEEN
jgi:hypothetical protein